MEDKDFEEVQIESTHAIEITDFILLDEVNPKYFYKPYFLEAQKGGEKGYALLQRALIETGKIGIAKVAIRSREYLAAVRPEGLFLMLELMHFAHEVLEPEGLNTPFGTELNPKEISMAKALVDTLSSEWQPEKYADRYQDALKDVIERKIQNRPATAKPLQPAAKGGIVDLMAVLQQSIAANADKRKTDSGERNVRPKSTGALVKQKRKPAV